MATTPLKASPFHAPPLSSSPSPFSGCIFFRSWKPAGVSFANRRNSDSARIAFSCLGSHRFGSAPFIRFVRFASGETETTETSAEVGEPEIQETGAVDGEDVGVKTAEDNKVEETEASVVLTSLQSYKEALANKDESRVTEIEAFLRSIEEGKVELEKKVASLSDELLAEKERVLRISADFDNFRKRTERERLSLLTNAQGEVVESLLPVLDNFERAKTQIKVETEAEEKIVNSYLSIFKQFMEIMGSLGVVPVETVGKPFDPMLHEAIMREDSAEFEEGIILEEHRKGFKLGDRLLRPSMVKVSAGPGPAKPQQAEEKSEEEEASGSSEDTEEAASS